jgi:hypothetical protein
MIATPPLILLPFGQDDVRESSSDLGRPAPEAVAVR